MKRLTDEIPPGALRVVVLSALARKPMHGYGLVQALLESTGGALELKEGTLYPILHELELEELVEARWEQSPEGRKRRVYSLTPVGKREVQADRKRWLAMAELLRALLSPARTA